MKAEGLLAHYARIADAPDAIAKLRRFVLNLAVRGKLVEQDAGDEPAVQMLAKINQAKEARIASGDLRKPRELARDEKVDQPFSVPVTWKWIRLDEVGAIVGGGTPSAGDPDNFAVPGQGIPWLTPADLGGFKGLYISTGSRYLSEKGARSSSATVMPQGTVLFTSRAPIGYVAIAANPLATNQGFKSVVPYVGECSRFIALVLETFAPEIDANAPGTTFKEVSGKIVAGISFPLAPLAEQHRIVAKVDELMALCDQLEAARAQREATRDRLAAASLARLKAPDPDTFPADARFALDALPALTTRPDQIKQLRQTILNLAVRGKLVPQISSDAPATDLVKLLSAAKAKTPEGKRTLPVIDPSDVSLIPRGWQAVRLGEAFSIRTGYAFKSSTYSKAGTLIFRVTNFDREGNINLSESVYFPSKQIDSAISKFLLDIEDVLMVMVGGTIGKTTVIDDRIMPALMNQNMWRMRSFAKLMPSKYEHLLIKSINHSMQGLTHSTHGHFAKRDYELRVIYLPPLAEQHRIVAKVDELMALCDQLEASLTTRETARRRLLDALLHEALAA